MEKVEKRSISAVQGGAVQDVLDESSSSDSDPETSGKEEARSSLANYQLAKDRPHRTIIPPARFDDYDCSEVAFTLSMFEIMNVEEPKDYAEARASKDW